MTRLPAEADAAQIAIRDESDIPMVRKQLRAVGRAAGLDEVALAAMATAVSEVARNIVVHAGSGEIVLRVTKEGDRRGVVAIARDVGPGIGDLERAMQDGYSTGNSLGVGLPGARRLFDAFELESTVGVGTTVTLKKWLA